MNATQTIPQQLSDHEARIRALETDATQPTKSWWLSKGVMGCLASTIASGAGAGTYSSILDYATDMATTRPVVGEGGSYAPVRETDDRDTVGLGDLL